MIKRNNVIRILTCCLILCFAFGVSLMSMPIAKAQTDAPDQIIMETGASVRLSESEDSDFADATGIRFRLLINQKWYEGLKVMDGETAIYPEIGMYIAIYDQMTEEQIQVEETAANAKFHFVLTDRANLKEVVPAQGENSAILAFNAVIAGIPETDFNTKLIANGYVQPSGGDKQFATNPQIATVAGAASKTIIDNLNYPDEDLDPYGDLVNYVDKVVEQEGFSFEDTAITTDMSDKANLTVGASLPENLSAIWKSSNESVATVDASGNITKVGVGTTNITATLGSITNSCTLEIVDGKYAVAVRYDTQNDIYYLNNAARSEYVSANSDAIKDFSGDYDGNAVRLHAQGGYQGQFQMKNNFTETELKALKANYNTVSLYVAYNIVKTSESIADGDAYVNFLDYADYPSFFAKANYIGVKRYSDCKAWTKLSISLDDYIALAANNSYSHVILFNLGQNNSIDRTASGIYVGSVVFEFIAPEPLNILTISSSTWTNYKYANATNSNYIKYAEASSITNITGDYKGNAVAYRAFDVHRDEYSLYNDYTLEQLTEYSKTYNAVSVWVAFTSNLTAMNFRDAAVTANYTTKMNFRQEANVTGITTNTWVKWTISIYDYIDMLEVNNYAYAVLFAGKPTQTDSSEFCIYFGDLIFENTKTAYLLDVCANNYKQYSYNGNTTAYTTFVEQPTGFDGNYTGSAVKYLVRAGHSGQYRVNNQNTITALTAAKERYTHVSIYVAYNLVQKADTTGNCNINYLSNQGTNFFMSAGITGSSHASTYQMTWTKVSISIDEYISLITSNYVVLFRPGDKAANVDDTSGIYLGDIILEKIEN